ncbi:MAG: UDP-N-acetylmuramoyl-L-alanine--D-glutamate ligase [Chloroflexi bacterium]|nr:UDP-N-acetylmuramoyl-L-alanine--D-glutamate ligase [Chloroflexota bacterium]
MLVDKQKGEGASARAPNLGGARVTVVGLGIEGIDLTRFLAAEGARVTVSDIRTREELAEPLAAIEDSGATLSLGANREQDMTDADCVFVSQGVPPDLPALRAARRAGVPISSMTRLFLERCPVPVAGITGSSGKTTTTALVGEMLAEAGEDHVVGGNIGVGLLALLDQIGPETRVVLELSHTQLESIDRSPQLACVTNVTPNHLDRYSWSSYVALKRRIFEHQQGDDLAIFHIDDEVAAAFAEEAPARVRYTSLLRPLPGDGVTVSGDLIVRREDGRETEVMRRDEIPLRGDHNAANVVCALALASGLGVADESASEAVRRFQGVPHRLEPVATVRGVQYVNDSIATTPERTLAGMRTYEEPLVLLLGGRDKHLPLGELASEAVERCRAVVAFGEAGPVFATAIAGARDGERPVIEQAASIEEAVAAAARLARAGDVVLCAPAGTSFDAYRNFEQRGAAFREAVAGLEESD